MFLKPLVLCRRCRALLVPGGGGRVVQLSCVQMEMTRRLLQTSAGLYQRYRKTHYETLGLMSNASQADIKSAYYKLSMKYHPDKNKGAEEKFKDITQAYEVLGNPRMRRLYDRGIISHNDDEDTISQYGSASESDTPMSETMGDHTEASRVSATNYDQWSKSQASASFNRAQEAKRKKSKLEEVKHLRREDAKAENVIWLLVGLGLVIMGYSKVGNTSKSDSKKDEGP